MSLRDLFRRRSPKVFVIGLDCAAPELVFDRWRADLPNLNELTSTGLSGELASSIPAITVPAWSSMLSGRDPGELGIYGFRNRADHSYDRHFIATSNYVQVPRIWDYLTAAGKESVVVAVPQTYPPRSLKGFMIAGFLTPSIESDFTYPSELKQEILAISPEYEVDVSNFRTDDKDWLLRQIREMTDKRIRVVDHLLVSKPWDFFMLMEIGVDRIHHGFWSYHDPMHRRYEPGNRFENAIHDYYVDIDSAIGRWRGMLDDDTVILVVSDHGAQRMDGGVCLNEWLWRNGWLAFEEDPPAGRITRIDDLKIDWPRTKAWGAGGYYGRVYLNVKGREPQGQIDRGDYETIRSDLGAQLQNIPGPDGEDLGTKVFKPQELYRMVRGVPPDLMIYFGDLLWRSVGSLGYGEIYTFDNDTGPDDCNHAQNGLFILHDPNQNYGGQIVADAQLMDVTPTLLNLFGIEVPDQVQGTDLTKRIGSTPSSMISGKRSGVLEQRN